MTNSPISPDIEAREATALPGDPSHYTNPRRGFLFFFAFATLGAAMTNLVPIVLTLSLKAQIIDPKNGPGVLSIAALVGAVCTIIAFPLFGRISDRTLSRLGRRRPMLILSAVLVIVGAVVTYLAQDTFVLTLGWVLTTVGYCAVAVAGMAIIADQFEPGKRGPASAVMGLSLPVGAVIGLFIAQLVSTSLTAMIFLPAILGAIGIILFAIVLKDRQITAAERPAFTVVSFFSTFWVNPFRNPNYGWAWWSRFLIWLGVAGLNSYQAFYLIYTLHFSATAVAGAIFLSILVLTGAALVVAAGIGKLSDRIQRRKPFVIVAAVIFAVGLAVAASAQSYQTFLIAMAITGIGQGVYVAVDVALVSVVLPDANNPGQAMGVLNLASSLPNSIVPAVGPAVILIGASAAHPQNFSALFIGGAIAAVIGALAILPIRRVR